MCECIELANKALAAKNTRVEHINILPDMSERIAIRTVKINERSRTGPVTLMATFCPFCGVKLDV